MSLAAKLRNSVNETTKINEAAKKMFQSALFGEPETVIEVLGTAPEPRPMTDPRPDLAEDSALWVRFLELAGEKDKQLAWTLHGFRCQGTRLRQGRSGYVLRPELDPTKGWTSRQEYEKERDRWLMPHISVIAELLKRL